MYSLRKPIVDENQGIYQSDTTVESPDPDPADPWLFTDPSARYHYTQQGLVDQLEEDIRDYAMYYGFWAPEELEYKLEVRRLLRECYITPWNSYGYLSPHPTIYRTLKKGILEVSEKQYRFSEAEDLICSYRNMVVLYDGQFKNGGKPICIAAFQRPGPFAVKFQQVNFI